MKYSVVLPVYNEEEVISSTIHDIVAVFNRMDLEWEIVAVDDGSDDQSVDVLRSLESEFGSAFKLVRHPYNKGNGATIKTGIRNASGEVIVCMDCDGQHDPEDILKMLPFLGEYDLIVGARPFKEDGVWYRNLANRFYNGLASRLTDFKIEDLTSGFRIFKADVVKKFYHLFPQHFSYPTTSTLALLKGGYNIKYVPINIQPRKTGASKIRLFRDGLRFTTIIFKIILLFEPMRVFLPVTAAAFILGFVSTILGMIQAARLYVPNSAVVLFVLGVISFLMGILAEHTTAIQMAIIEKD